MTITAFTPHPRAAGGQLAARRGVLAFALRALQVAARNLACRRAHRELLEMPESLLKDIGISRSEVRSVVHFGMDDTTRLHRGATVVRPAPSHTAARPPIAPGGQERT